MIVFGILFEEERSKRCSWEQSFSTRLCRTMRGRTIQIRLYACRAVLFPGNQLWCAFLFLNDCFLQHSVKASESVEEALFFCLHYLSDHLELLWNEKGETHVPFTV